MQKLLILDKDGTLATPKSGSRFVQAPDDQILLPGVAEALERYRDAGWVMAIASNQGGVAAGHKTLGSALDEMFFAMGLTGINWAMAAHSNEQEYGEALFFDITNGGAQWKHVTNARKNFRKPAAGMIDYLATRITGDRRWRPGKVLFVGDRPEDQGAAQAAGVRFLWAHEWGESQP